MVLYAWEKWIKHYHLAGSGIGEYVSLAGVISGLIGITLGVLFKPLGWKYAAAINMVVLAIAIVIILFVLTR
jgi:hypothetical protein